VLVPSTGQATAPATPRWHLHSRLPLAAFPLAPSFARAHVRYVARKWGLASDLATTAQLIASELVTNAVQASDRSGKADRATAAPVVRLSLASDRVSLVLRVWDGSHEIPLRQQLVPDQERGWGLVLVDSLAAEWGVYPQAGGKVVWALIR
jgi:anti-sigma regulatory factor (Ser/Thr protein kinase)